MVIAGKIKINNNRGDGDMGSGGGNEISNSLDKISDTLSQIYDSIFKAMRGQTAFGGGIMGGAVLNDIFVFLVPESL